MRKVWIGAGCLPLMALLLAGCSGIGDKAASISVIYGITAALSFVLLVLYCIISKKRNVWYLLLFLSVLVVNVGYFALAISLDLKQALFANRLAYLGSVFLPLAMWMIILQATHIPYKKWLPGVLLGISAVVFLIAASPGYLPIYYREVSFQRIEGVSTLVKVYGPLHVIYLVYLMAYFVVMVASIVHATVKDMVDSIVHATILAIAVFVNIGVWLIEQLVRIDFEILSVSYIISESFLLGLNLLLAEAQRQKEQAAPQPVPAQPEATPAEPQHSQEQTELFLSGIPRLTPQEQRLYDCYIAGMTTAQILEALSIKENTLKFHSKNLYSKLGVSSRKQLSQLHRQCAAQQEENE